MKSTLISFFLFLITLSTFSQELKSKDYYQLGRYQIYPEARIVKTEHMVGGTEYDENGNAVGHWDGYQYLADPLIDYDNTTLYFIGNNIVFQEYLKPKINIRSLKVFKSGFDQYYSDILCVDNRHIYDDIYKSEDDDEDDDDNDNSDENGDTYHVRGKKYLGNRIYKDKKGELYVFDNDDEQLVKLDKNFRIDLPTLKHVYDQYFYDKNGFYYLGKGLYDSEKKEYFKQKTLEKSFGQSIVPIVQSDYIVYGKNIYTKNSNGKKLHLIFDKIKAFDVYYKQSFLTDGIKSYYNFEEVEREEFNQTSDWQQITSYGSVLLILDDQDNTIYFPSEKKSYKNQKQTRSALIKNKNHYLLIDTDGGLIPRGWKTTEYKNAHIFNFHTKEYESLDITQYKYIGDELYVYKGILYSNDCSPVVERDQIDVENLKPFYYKGNRTEYYTDGNILLYHGNRTGYRLTSDEYPQIYYESRIVKNVDFKTLKAVSEDILVDKNNIYNGYYNGIEVIPVQKLGLKIVMYTED